MTEVEKKILSSISLMILSLTLLVSSGYLLVKFANYQTAIAIFFALWGNNIFNYLNRSTIENF
jgi:hypothetical protein